MAATATAREHGGERVWRKRKQRDGVCAGTSTMDTEREWSSEEEEEATEIDSGFDDHDDEDDDEDDELFEQELRALRAEERQAARDLQRKEREELELAERVLRQRVSWYACARFLFSPCQSRSVRPSLPRMMRRWRTHPILRTLDFEGGARARPVRRPLAPHTSIATGLTRRRTHTH